MNRTKSALAVEVLQEIFSYLTRSELTRVCLVNHSILSASRTFLYRSIDLSSDDTYISWTLNLLSVDWDLGSKIQSARLQTVPRPHLMNETWINPNIFENWTGLKTLRLVGCPFLGASMHQFRDVLRENCRLLAEIAFQPNADMEIAGIMGVQWGGQSTLAEFTLQPALLSDTSSVTHLSFGGTVVHGTNHPVSAIFQYTFPGLISLDLGSLTVCDEPDWSRQSVTQFLLNNPGIQHLSLGKERPLRNIFFDLHPPSLSPGFLPHLRSFEGFPKNMVVMAGAQVKCLDQLQSLALVSTEGEEDMEAMFSAFPGRILPSVRRLHVELYSGELSHRMPSNVNFMSHINWMLGFGGLCPNATEVFAKLPPVCGEMLRRLFVSFKSLESLSIPLLSLSLNMSANQIEFFGPIAQQCPRLQFVKARKPGLQKGNIVFSFCRNDVGNLVEVSIA